MRETTRCKSWGWARRPFFWRIDSVITEITDINGITGWFKWLPILGLPALALAARGKLPGWGWMWVMALALFIAAKWITIFRLLFSKARVSWHRLIAYFLLWPGMDASAFCAEKPATTPAN